MGLTFTGGSYTKFRYSELVIVISLALVTSVYGQRHRIVTNVTCVYSLATVCYCWNILLFTASPRAIT